MPDYLLGFGIVAVVLSVTPLASGLVERSPLSFPIIFLGLGFLLGQRGLDVIQMGAHDPFLEILATLTLALVLFLDAVKLQIDELGKRWLAPVLILGPGTGIIIALGAVSLSLVVGFSWLIAFIGGAILASTDPVVLRDIVRDPRIPRSVRQVLKIEAGTNDLVVLPVVLILIAVATQQGGDSLGWASFVAKLLVLGPAIGFAVGGVGSWLMAKVDSRMGIRREYQALYGLGLVLASFAAATVAGGDGFLGAFAAGIAVILLNQSLCDCFLEYGEVTSEMAMLLAFVLFGVVLARARMSWAAHGFVSWFGPRGLNSLLLALLAVQADVPGAELLLATVGGVVLASVSIHGATALPFTAWYGRRAAEATLDEERESTAAGLFAQAETEVPRITPQELKELMSAPEPLLILDVRTRSTYEHSGLHIAGDVRMMPDQVVEWASECAGSGLTVVYCD